MKENVNAVPDEEMNSEQDVQQKHDNLSAESDKNQAENDENADKEEPVDDNEVKQEEKKKNRSFFGKKKSEEEDKLKKELEELDVKYKELNDRFLRLYSEFDNYKKRTNKEKLDLLSTASEKVIVGLLPVIDDFERAIAANEKVEDVAAIKEGFVLIYNKLLQLLKRFDVEEIQAKGEEFNTDYHEAITHFPAQKEEDKGKVMDVTEKGYKLKDKVIRYSKVVVAN
ncbi:MAG: nucleotide exchange factor GrpE [Bacteroidales bacterium]|nr:nucleotide exchange factor GrpE [Bacteroidales bacterium]